MRVFVVVVVVVQGHENKTADYARLAVALRQDHGVPAVVVARVSTCPDWLRKAVARSSWEHGCAGHPSRSEAAAPPPPSSSVPSARGDELIHLLPPGVWAAAVATPRADATVGILLMRKHEA
uniref:Uncharacterized protein n=1 Tax=Oryza meridionalis TaxID=40149 RepID=A0A0E0EBT4_9ORYZ